MKFLKCKIIGFVRKNMLLNQMTFGLLTEQSKTNNIPCVMRRKMCSKTL